MNCRIRWSLLPAIALSLIIGLPAISRAQVSATRSGATVTAGTPLVTCKDGTLSTSRRRRACSGRGGIVRAKSAVKVTRGTAWVLRAPKATSKAVGVGNGDPEDNDPADSIAKCKDGLYSHAKHRVGACSRHGGVAAWL